jgi:hypothetical protein
VRGYQSLNLASLLFLPPSQLTTYPPTPFLRSRPPCPPYSRPTRLIAGRRAQAPRNTPPVNDLRPMSSPVATTAHDLPLPKPHAPSQHQYGTRIRSNSVIKPSVRLRQASDIQRRIKPVPAVKPPPTVPESPGDMPDFPPPQVMLHADDANNKVFHAIGRSFMSVVCLGFLCSPCLLLTLVLLTRIIKQ